MSAPEKSSSLRDVVIGEVTSATLPAVIGLVRTFVERALPTGEQSPTDVEILVAFSNLCARSLAVDDAWLATHPERPPAP